AYIQFTTIDRGTDPDYRPSEGDPSLKITGVAAASHATIPQQEPGNNITSRPRTTAQVIWEDIPVWVGHGVTGEAQRTADISAILQELVDLPAWSATGDAMIIIENNSGDPASNFRQIATHNDAPEKAPVLYFDWELPRAALLTPSRRGSRRSAFPAGRLLLFGEEPRRERAGSYGTPGRRSRDGTAGSRAPRRPLERQRSPTQVPTPA